MSHLKDRDGAFVHPHLRTGEQQRVILRAVWREALVDLVSVGVLGVPGRNVRYIRVIRGARDVRNLVKSPWWTNCRCRCRYAWYA